MQYLVLDSNDQEFRWIDLLVFLNSPTDECFTTPFCIGAMEVGAINDGSGG
jgi:hypothetical protein